MAEGTAGVTHVYALVRAMHQLRPPLAATAPIQGAVPANSTSIDERLERQHSRATAVCGAAGCHVDQVGAVLNGRWLGWACMVARQGVHGAGNLIVAMTMLLVKTPGQPQACGTNQQAVATGPG